MTDDIAKLTEITDDNWYPVHLTKPDPSAPRYVNLDLYESSQIQEMWAIINKLGFPDVMCWIDGHFVEWWPCLSIDRAKSLIRRAPGR